MPKRRLASLLALATAVVVAASGCSSTATAVRVDDESISQRDFEDQLDLVYENDDFRSLLFGDVDRTQLRGEGDPRSSYRQEFVEAMAFLQVQFLVIPQVLTDQDIELVEGDRQAVIEQIDQQAPGSLDDLPEGVRDEYVDAFAGFDKLRAELGDEELNAVVGDAIRGADVSVSSRYGTWEPDSFSVTPPQGPRPAPGTDDGSGAGLPEGSELPSG